MYLLENYRQIYLRYKYLNCFYQKCSFFFFVGNPKGAMLTHGNVVADFSGFLKVTEVNTSLCDLGKPKHKT